MLAPLESINLLKLENIQERMGAVFTVIRGYLIVNFFGKKDIIHPIHKKLFSSVFMVFMQF